MKEHSDGIEREYKFHWTGGEEAVLQTLRRFLTPERVLIKQMPRSRLDIYLDGPDLSLLPTGASVRLRKRLSRSGWSLNFKPATAPFSEFMERREIRTNLSNDEALSERIPGLAASECYVFLEAIARGPSSVLCPVVCLYSNRSIYTLTDLTATGPVERCHVSFDHVTAVDIRGLDMAPLVRGQTLDCSGGLITASFGVLELDAVGVLMDGFWDHDQETIEFLESLGKALRPAHQVVRQNKYQQAAELLALTAVTSTWSPVRRSPASGPGASVS